MKWPTLKLLRTPRRINGNQPRRSVQLHLEELESRDTPAVDVLTFHNDIAGLGVNSSENQLTPANVKVGSFGKIYSTSLDGQVYAEPLVKTAVNITAGVNTTAGAAGIHDVVFVATEHDSLYAIDAGVTGGAVLWKRSFLGTANPTGDTNNTLGATAIVAMLSGYSNSGDIMPEIGITGTPVIDPATNTLYVVVKTQETIGGALHFVQRLHAINISDGTDRVTPYMIGDTTGSYSNNTAIYVYGSGDGHVTDPYNGTGRQVVQFNALREHQRTALSLVNNTVYVQWASHGDNGPYHGWVVGWNVANLTTNGFRVSGVLNTSPNDGLAGIWGGGGRLTFEADGSAFYFETGNGSGGAPTLNASGFPVDGNYNEALVKVMADPTTSATNQNINGWGFKVVDYFIPYNVAGLDNADSDFGSGSPIILPDSAGIAGHPHLMLAAGKEGKIYLIDRDNLGKFDPVNDHVINAVPNGSGHNTPPNLIGGSLSTPSYYNGMIYWITGYNGAVNAYTISSNGTLTRTSQTANKNFGYLPGSVTVSSNGSVGGIVWAMDRNANQIHAYDATTLSTELWNSGQRAGGADSVGAVMKFAVPTVANGKVYVGTNDSLVVYGLTPPAGTVPNAPVLAATALSGTSINLTWTDSSVSPNTATGYKIEQSTNNVDFTQVTTAPAGATSIAIGGLTPLTTYYFRIRGFNGVGDSNVSNTANATTTNQVALLDFSSGFAGSTNRLTYNGSAAIVGAKAEVTNGGGNQAGSFFSTSAVDITRFNTQFTFQLTAGTSTADGMTFTIQGIGPTARGPSGGGLGYGPDHVSGTGGIASSVAVKFDLYSNEGEGVNSTGLYTNGAAPTNVGSILLTPSNLDLHSGHVFQVNMTYDGTTLAVTIKDTVTGVSATQNYTINIPTVIGRSTAYVGFTGGTGGQTVTQDILSWNFAPNAATSPNAPSGLGATPASATSVSLNWTNNATNQTGYHLDRALDAGFTQSLITQTLPAGPITFTDIASGLAPGGTFYYRLRAFNSAGDSGNSNMATVFIPLAPPKPSNQAVTNVTANQIDLIWQDNAGHQADSYSILRAVDHGSFSLVASLPPTSRTPPSNYEWSDTNLTPGTYYEYHIVAVNVSGSNDFAGVNTTTLTQAPGSVSATGSNGLVTLSWTAPKGAVSYNVYRGTSAGGEGVTPLATGITATTYSDLAVTNGTTYYYTVTAVNANAGGVPVLPSESAQSAEVVATPSTVATLAAPTGVVAAGTPTNTGTARSTLTWTASAGATSYNVYRSLTSNGQGATPLASGVTTTSFIDSTVSFGTTYYYKVTAVNASGESVKSSEANVTPLFVTHVLFTSDPTQTPSGYVADTGLVNGARANGLAYGWNVSNTAAMRDRDNPSSPDELHDAFAHMQNVGNAYWAIAVPNGTYTVHLLAGDPNYFDSTYRISVGGTLSGGAVSGGVLAINGVPTTTNRWIENTVTVTVTGGILYVSNASGSSNNKINEIDISQTSSQTPPPPPPSSGVDYSAGFAGATGLSLNGSTTINGSKLELTNGGGNQVASTFTTSKISVAKFDAQFSFQLVNPSADGFTFALQSTSPTALGQLGGGLGYGPDHVGGGGASIANSVAIKFDLYDNQGEGVNSTGVYLNGAAPTNVGSVNLTGSGIDLHSGHVFNVSLSYDGTILTEKITDATTGASFTQTYTVNIASAVPGSQGYVGFTAGTGGLSATQDILSFKFTPTA